MNLTYRQTACLLERYWERKVWDIETNVITNPMASFEDDKKEAMIDATTDASITQLQQALLPIKRV